MPTHPSGSSSRAASSLADQLGDQADASLIIDLKSTTTRKTQSMPKTRLAPAQSSAPTNRERLCRVFNETYDPDSWSDWRWQLRHRLTSPPPPRGLPRADRPGATRSVHGRRAFRRVGDAALRGAHESLRSDLSDPPPGGADGGRVHRQRRRHGGPVRRGPRVGGRRARPPLPRQGPAPRPRHLRILLPLLHPIPSRQPGFARCAAADE